MYYANHPHFKASEKGKIPVLSKKKKKTTSSKNTREGTWNGLSWKEKNKEQRENV